MSFSRLIIRTIIYTEASFTFIYHLIIIRPAMPSSPFLPLPPQLLPLPFPPPLPLLLLLLLPCSDPPQLGTLQVEG